MKVPKGKTSKSRKADMKTRLVMTVGAVAAAFTMSVRAVDVPLYPKADSGPRVIEASAVKDPNLISEYPKAGSRGIGATAVAATGPNDADTLAAVKKCGMTPKTKDTADCKKMCETAAHK